MKKILFLIAFTVTYSSVFPQETGMLTDPRDGKVYKTIKICNKWVMAESLSYKPGKGTCWADTIYIEDSHLSGYIVADSSYIKRNGYFYDYETANSIAIPGWHVPSKDEWKELFDCLGGSPKKVYSAMIEGGNSGFNAILSGLGYFSYGSKKTRVMLDQTVCFWTSSKLGFKGLAVGFVPPATRYNAGATRIGIAGAPGCSVRLFKD